MLGKKQAEKLQSALSEFETRLSQEKEGVQAAEWTLIERSQAELNYLAYRDRASHARDLLRSYAPTDPELPIQYPIHIEWLALWVQVYEYCTVLQISSYIRAQGD